MGHEQLVQGVSLTEEVEAVLKVGRLGLVLDLEPRIPVTALSSNSVLRNRKVRKMLGTPFQEGPMVSMKTPKSCFHFLNTAKDGLVESSGIL